MKMGPDGITKLASRIRRPWGTFAVALAGAAAAVVLLGSLAACNWEARRQQKDSVDRARKQQLPALGRLIAQAAEAMLSSDQLPALGRLVAEASTGYGLDTCRILLPGGQVIADAEPSNVRVTELPASWPRMLQPAEAESVSQDGSLRFVLHVPGRGDALLELASAPSAAANRQWPGAVVLGVIGTAILVAWLVLFQRIRSKFRA
ncbi:unnamed protein product, partial [marine sediment metagenome]